MRQSVPPGYAAVFERIAGHPSRLGLVSAVSYRVQVQDFRGNEFVGFFEQHLHALEQFSAVFRVLRHIQIARQFFELLRQLLERAEVWHTENV